MFAVVRTGGKQYRVAPGDKIVVEKMDGETGDKITLGDILLAGEGSDLKSTSGLTVAAEIIAQAKGDKVTVFKKRRRHNYRRKKGHRQQHTILRIVAIGDHKAEKKADSKPAAAKAEGAPKPAKTPKPSDSKAPPQAEEQETPNPAPDDVTKADPDKAAKAKKAAPAKAAKAKKAAPAKAAAAKPAKAASTKKAAPAKGAAKKTPKAK
ncbi:MAG: 50S ribosomal protein L21 [Sphingomicrobium sp.]